MLVGLTGGIACGKNFISDLFTQLGCDFLDADNVARIVVAKDGEAYQNLVDAFGTTILSSTGEIDRNQLRTIVIQDPQKRRLLETITHPAISNYAMKWYKSLKAHNSKVIAIYNAPVLIESGAYKKCDSIILIYTSKENQLKRLKERGYPPLDDALKLMSAQMPFEEKLNYANHIINNDSDVINAKEEVERVFNLLKTFQYTSNINKRGRR